MIVTVTRHPTDIAEIRRSGVRAATALSLDAGIHAATGVDVQLLVCYLRTSAPSGGGMVARLRDATLPCPLLLRHDLSRDSIAALYGIAQIDADIRPSFRLYDGLAERIRSAPSANDMNATPTILRRLATAIPGEVRDLVGAMAILGERPVMQAEVATALGMSRSSFRQWLADLRRDSPGLPRFPGIIAVFVGLHFGWRREHSHWNGKRAAAAAGFSDEKAAAHYLRYHLGKPASRAPRVGTFDALMTRAAKMFAARPHPRSIEDAVRRI